MKRIYIHILLKSKFLPTPSTLLNFEVITEATRLSWRFSPSFEIFYVTHWLYVWYCILLFLHAPEVLVISVITEQLHGDRKIKYYRFRSQVCNNCMIVCCLWMFLIPPTLIWLLVVALLLLLLVTKSPSKCFTYSMQLLIKGVALSPGPANSPQCRLVVQILVM